jgi:hypothetical protein
VRFTSSKLARAFSTLGLSTLVVGYMLAGCHSVTDPLPENAARFTPPAVYSRWWAMTEACSGYTGSLATVEWYKVPGPQFTHNGHEAGGYYNIQDNQIVLAEDFVETGKLVRHEMLHALLRVGGHPRAQFLGACASRVMCLGSCLSDAGPWHDPSPFTVMPSDSLDVTAQATLLPPETDGQRWFALEVSVKNPHVGAIVAAAPPDIVPPPSFFYDLRTASLGGIAAGEVALDSSTIFFQPGETKRWLFEFKVAADLSENHIPPGSVMARGGYGYARHWSPYQTVTIEP